jgi:hypothetical protein
MLFGRKLEANDEGRIDEDETWGGEVGYDWEVVNQS